MEFRVGDRIKTTASTDYAKGDEGYIREIGISASWVKFDNGRYTTVSHGYMRKLERGKPMSKYQSLKERIDNVTAWDKECDDILEEIGTKYNFIICSSNSSFISLYPSEPNIKRFMSCDGHKIESTIEKSFPYTSQCEKLEVFKKALLWLLDHSDIPKDIVGQEIKADIEGKTYKVKIIEEI